jgi:hypothetical protein
MFEQTFKNFEQLSEVERTCKVLQKIQNANSPPSKKSLLHQAFCGQL